MGEGTFLLQLLVFQLLLFSALALLLKHLMGRHATSATSHLAQLSQEYLSRQEELKKRLEEAERQYEERMRQAGEEAQKMRRQAAEEAEQEKRRILEEARAESERIVAQAVQTREALRRELEAGIEQRVLERACDLVQEILPRQLAEEVHHRWLEEVIHNGLLEMEPLRLKEKVQRVQVASAVALTTAQREKIQRKLEAALGGPLTMEETVEPRLIAGLTITLGHLVLDGSLASKLKEAARRRASEAEA